MSALGTGLTTGAVRRSTARQRVGGGGEQIGTPPVVGTVTLTTDGKGTTGTTTTGVSIGWGGTMLMITGNSHMLISVISHGLLFGSS